MTHTLRSVLVLAFALVAGLLIARLDAQASEVQGAVLLLLVTGALLGAVAPRVAPLTGVLLGAGVPITYLYLRQAGLPTQADGFTGTLLALVPALVGAAGGALLRRAMYPGQMRRGA